MLLLAASLVACGARSSYLATTVERVHVSDHAMETREMLRMGTAAPAVPMPETAAVWQMAGSAPMFNAADDAALSLGIPRRKLVRSADVRLRVENLEETDSAINALMYLHGAYSSLTTMTGNRWSYTIRVPSVSYDPFLAALVGMGRILHRSERTEDVSLHYFDLEGRLATRQELLHTFRSYLGRADNIQDILSVETRIANLQSEIDRTGGELRMLANQVDYSTITLFLEGPASAEHRRGPALAERIGSLFDSFSSFLATAVVFLTGLLLFGIPVLVISALLFWLFFGRIGLVKKLYRIAAGKKSGGGESAER